MVSSGFTGLQGCYQGFGLCRVFVYGGLLQWVCKDFAGLLGFWAVVTKPKEGLRSSVRVEDSTQGLSYGLKGLGSRFRLLGFQELRTTAVALGGSGFWRSADLEAGSVQSGGPWSTYLSRAWCLWVAC